MRSFVPGWMRARHETHGKVTSSLASRKALNSSCKGHESPLGTPTTSSFSHTTKETKCWKKVLGCFLNQESTESKHGPGGFTQRPQTWRVGWIQQGTRSSVFPPSVRVPRRHYPHETNWGRSDGVDFSVLRACSQNLQLILHLPEMCLLALRVFECQSLWTLEPAPGGSVPLRASICGMWLCQNFQALALAEKTQVRLTKETEAAESRDKQSKERQGSARVFLLRATQKRELNSILI